MPDFQSYAYLQQPQLTSFFLSSSINHEKLDVSYIIIFCVFKDSIVLTIIFQIRLGIFHSVFIRKIFIYILLAYPNLKFFSNQYRN